MSWLDEALYRESMRKLIALDGQVVTVRHWNNAAQDVISGKLMYVGIGLWSILVGEQHGGFGFGFLDGAVVDADDRYSVVYLTPEAIEAINALISLRRDAS